MVSTGAVGPAIALDFPADEAKACPLFVGRIDPRGAQRAEPGLAAEPPEGDRPAADLGLVDITNYLTFDLCRPLHVFDAAKLRGDLTLRFARPGEELAALDGRTYRLDDGHDRDRRRDGPGQPGRHHGRRGDRRDAETTDVVLEVALFDPLRTAATGRRLGIESDARTRFERGLDPELVLPATEFATRLIVELCGGAPGPAVVAGAVPAPAQPVRFRRARLAPLAGIELDPPEIETILAGLGFRLVGGPEEWQVQPPSGGTTCRPRPASSRSWPGCTAMTAFRPSP